MPGIEKALPIIGGISDSLNPLFGHLTNVKNRKFTREMYARQREDALSDWAMQNEYNSPRAQMQRFQEAGLNPALIYGQMSDASPVRQSSSSGGQASAPQSDATGSLSKIYDMKRTSAQVDLVGQQLRVMEEDIKLKQVQALATALGAASTKVHTERSQFELDLERELRDITIEGRKADVDRKKVDVNVMLAENLRKWELHPGNLKGQVLDNLNKAKQNAKTDAEIKHIDALIEKVKVDIELTAYDRELIRKNVNPKDPGVIRLLRETVAEILRKMGN